MLLNCFINLQAQNNNDSPLRASRYETDTIFVEISIDAIKQANIKLIEREYLIKINNEKDSIINVYNSYTDSICNNLHNVVNKYNNAVRDIQNLNDVIYKKDKKVRQLQKVSFGLGTGIILLILL